MFSTPARLALLSASLIGIVSSMPLPTPAPLVPGVAFTVTDGKISAGLSIKYSGRPLGQSVTGLLSLGGDINPSNLIEGGIQEADTESIALPLLTVIDGGAYSRPVDVSATINPTLLSADGLIGLVNGGFLGQSFTVLGGFPTAGINAAGQGTIDPTGALAYGPAAASGGIEAGIDPKTGVGLKASGHAGIDHLIGGQASASGGINSNGIEFSGLTAVGSALGVTVTIPIPGYTIGPTLIGPPTATRTASTASS